MAKKLVVLMAILLATAPAWAQTSLTGSGDFSGTAVLWFAGTDVTAKFTGQLSLSGSVTLDGHTFRFTAKGVAHGSGKGDSATLEGVGWVVFTLAGRTDTGGKIEIRGGVTGDAGSFTFSSDETAGAGTADFFALIILGDKKIEAAGQVNGKASGGFIPPDEQYTMQVEGTGTMEFRTSFAAPAGDSVTIGKHLPWKLSAWPADLRAEFLSLLGLEPEDCGSHSVYSPVPKD